jgi:hypothetical protein
VVTTDDKKDWGQSILENVLREIREHGSVEGLLRKAREDHAALRKEMGLEEELQDACKHEKCTPEYDHEEAIKINDAWEIKKRFPRFSGQCPDCGACVIMYASFDHYIMGDW